MPRLVVTQNERLLLHLLELDRFRDESEVPMATSQEGIAEKLNTQVFNASRALSSLESEGLVFDKLAHVRGAPRRRRAYFLTEKGRGAALSIRADIGKRPVVIEHGGKTQELSAEEATRKLTSLLGRAVSLSEIVELGREFDVIVSSALVGPQLPVHPSAEFVMRSHGRSRLGSFYGRESELATIEKALITKDTAAILVWGMPGIGKSTLASKLFESLIGKRSVFWYTFREWDTESSFLTALTEFLSASGAVKAVAAFRRGSDLAELYLPLLNDLTTVRPVLFLDDIQKPARDLSGLMQVLIEASRSSGNSTVVIISRTVPPSFPGVAQGNISVELSGLDRDSAWKLAESLNSKDARRLVEGSHGHPLLLNLMARGSVVDAKGDVSSFIEREVSSDLSPDEIHLMELLAVYRHPVPIEALEISDYGIVTALRKRALVTEQEEGISTHDLLKEFFGSHMPTEKKLKLHELAAKYCERQDGIEWGLEALFHWTEAQDAKSAYRVASARAEELVKEFPRESFSLLSRIDLHLLDKREQAEVLLIRGQTGEALGMHESALHDLEQSVGMLGDSDPTRKAVVLGALATLQSESKMWSEALVAHEKALRIYERSGDRDGQAREWLSIGGVHRRMGDLATARDEYKKALALASTTENRPTQAACLNNLALLDWDAGSLVEAERRFKESVKLAHTIKDHSGEGHGLENLAGLYRAVGRLPEAAAIFQESAEAFLRADDASEFKRLEALSAETLGMSGKYDRGIDLCEKTLARPELTRRRGLFQRAPRYDPGDSSLSYTIVELSRGAGDLKRAQKELARYQTMAESIGDPSLKARGWLLLGIIHEESGELDAALVALAKAETHLKSADNIDGLIAVYMRRGMVEEKKGDYATAGESYGQAARLAERTEDRSALRLALESLESVK